MRFPVECKTIIDVTKPPYNADNSGRMDCTRILVKILDDILVREVIELEATAEKIRELSNNGEENVYIGLETGHMQNGKLGITYPEYLPPARIIYFPAGTYLISDTITYTLENLKNKYYVIPQYENCRKIFIVGEDMEKTTIKLQDNCEGFGEDAQKPMLSFINHPYRDPKQQEVTNVAFMNTILDIGFDCGKGNPGAVGFHYISSNIGRIENVRVTSQNGQHGIYTLFGSEGVVRNVVVSGFDYGMVIGTTCTLVLDHIDVSGNRIAGIKTFDAAVVASNITSGAIPNFEFSEGNGRYYFIDDDVTFANDCCGNKVYFEKDLSVKRNMEIPYEKRDDSDVAFVDDYGATGDYTTDSTRAIQRAMNSGKSTVVFGEGEYLICAKIKIPRTVRRINFMFCSLATGIRLVGGEYDAAFEADEDSVQLLTVENLFAFERFKGNIRFFKHACRRDVVFRNIQLMSASMYFNSVSGSNVYFDNCFLTTGTYTRTAWIPGDGFVPVYSHIIPYEFHGQHVLGRMINAERADVHMLNDASDVWIDFFRTEGPGTALKSINGGRTVINVMNAGIGYKYAENALYDLCDSTMTLTGAVFFGFDIESEYNVLIQSRGKFSENLCWDDYEEQSKPFRRFVDYDSIKQDD